MPASLIDETLKQSSSGKTQADKVSKRFEVVEDKLPTSDNTNISTVVGNQTQTSPAPKQTATPNIPKPSEDLSSNVINLPGSSTEQTGMTDVAADDTSSAPADVAADDTSSAPADVAADDTSSAPADVAADDTSASTTDVAATDSSQQQDEQPPPLPEPNTNLPSMQDTQDVEQPEEGSSTLLIGALLLGGGFLTWWMLKGKK